MLKQRVVGLDGRLVIFLFPVIRLWGTSERRRWWLHQHDFLFGPHLSVPHKKEN